MDMDRQGEGFEAGLELTAKSNRPCSVGNRACHKVMKLIINLRLAIETSSRLTTSIRMIGWGARDLHAHLPHCSGGAD